MHIAVKILHLPISPRDYFFLVVII